MVSGVASGVVSSVRSSGNEMSSSQGPRARYLCVSVRAAPEQDHVAHGTHDGGRVAETLVDAPLDVVLTQEQRVAAHETVPRLGRQSGARRALVTTTATIRQ